MPYVRDGLARMGAIVETFETACTWDRFPGLYAAVRAEVGATGTPSSVTLVRRSGSRDLDRAALDAVREWHFRPAIENGKAVASTVEVPVDFRLAER